MQPAPPPTGVALRSRRLLVAATMTVLLIAAAVWATTALALPPGGPLETRGGATLGVSPTFVRTPVPGDASTGVVAFSGTGYAPGEVLVVKVDDGAIRPATPPVAPPGAVGNTDDGFTWVTADGSGAVAGSIDLKDTRSLDVAKVQAGKHHLRLIGDAPRSIHADFLIRATGPAQTALAPTVSVAPPADQPVSWGAQAPFADVPKLVTGSRIPYRISGFSPKQVVGVKVDDQNLPGTTSPNGTWTTIQTDATGSASGTLALPDTPGTTGTAPVVPGVSPYADGAHWLRFLAGSIVNSDGDAGTPRSVVAPYAVDTSAAPRSVSVGASGQRGRSVALTGSGLTKESFYLNGGTGNTGDGQTVTARIDGTGTPFNVRANDDGSLASALPIPAGTSLGTHTVVLWVGFRAGSDFPQSVQERTFEVTELVPDPVVTAPQAATTTPTAPTAAPPVATPAKPAPAPAPAPRAAAVSSSVLKASKAGRVPLSLVRPSVATRAAVTVRTAARVGVPGARKKRVVTLVRSVTVSHRPGTAKQRSVVTLKLTTEGRALLRKLRTVRVVVRVAPRGGKVVTRTLKLRG